MVIDAAHAQGVPFMLMDVSLFMYMALRGSGITHVCFRTRPLHSSECNVYNIEKVGVTLGTRLGMPH